MIAVYANTGTYLPTYLPMLVKVVCSVTPPQALSKQAKHKPNEAALESFLEKKADTARVPQLAARPNKARITDDKVVDSTAAPTHLLPHDGR